jgi:hypothetical protein
MLLDGSSPHVAAEMVQMDVPRRSRSVEESDPFANTMVWLAATAADPVERPAETCQCSCPFSVGCAAPSSKNVPAPSGLNKRGNAEFNRSKFFWLARHPFLKRRRTPGLVMGSAKAVVGNTQFANTVQSEDEEMFSLRLSFCDLCLSGAR